MVQLKLEESCENLASSGMADPPLGWKLWLRFGVSKRLAFKVLKVHLRFGGESSIDASRIF